MTDIPKALYYAFGALIPVAAAVYLASMRWLKIIRLPLKFDSLPPEFDGFKILHISDLHSFSENRILPDIWRVIESLDFDAAVITGDIIKHKTKELYSHANALRSLAQRKPIYFVDGNHEKYIYPELSKYLRSLGVCVLANERVSVLRKGAEINIIGLRDYEALINDKKSLSKLDALLKYGGFKLVLEHQPQLFDRIKDKGPLLMLCGHTHGGQVRFPFLPVLFAPGQGILPKYGYGLYESGKAKMFISKGIGTTDFPIRFYNRPEIGLITLRRTL